MSVAATLRFPGHIRQDLEQGLGDLSGKSFYERAGKALRVLGDFILLGEEEQGLEALKARVSEDVASWLNEHAREAVGRVKACYR